MANWFYAPFTHGMTEVFPVYEIAPDYEATRSAAVLGYTAGLAEAEKMTGKPMVFQTVKSGKAWTQGWFVGGVA